MAKTLVVSGAAGFLGGHLCQALVAAGHRVTGLVRDRSNLARLEGLPVTLLRSDSPAALRAFEWSTVDALVHTAVNYGRGEATASELVRDNVLFPLELVARLPATCPVINTDSFYSKPGNAYLPGYTLCKRQILEWLRVDTDRPVVNARIEHVFGPHDSPAKFVPTILAKLLADEPTIALSEGTQERDFVFVGDVTAAYLTILDRVPALEPGMHEVELGRGQRTSVRSFVELMKQVTGSASQLDFGARPLGAGEIEASQADTARIAAWGWAPSWTLERGLAACVAALEQRRDSA